jgi:hypothetical protein
MTQHAQDRSGNNTNSISIDSHVTASSNHYTQYFYDRGCPDFIKEICSFSVKVQFNITFKSSPRDSEVPIWIAVKDQLQYGALKKVDL